MKTDTIFYRLFQSFPSIFFELINQPPETANAYQFSSVEVKQLAFRIDGVFLPKSNPSSPIYFVEVQFQPDKKFYSRLFTEIFLYLDKTKLTNNWRGVVVYPSRSIDIGETERYIELLTSGRVTRIYLDELDSTAEQSIGIETGDILPRQIKDYGVGFPNLRLGFPASLVVSRPKSPTDDTSTGSLTGGVSSNGTENRDKKIELKN
ncbi:MAG: Rpn family recombination-promoting nuclease/putative transposase [Scytonema sp. RU_4_4]|nr:Rpn family recombination-promoting nuclease/putative transposase [Scytonema sp. RU_4_4]